MSVSPNNVVLRTNTKKPPTLKGNKDANDDLLATLLKAFENANQPSAVNERVPTQAATPQMTITLPTIPAPVDQTLSQQLPKGKVVRGQSSQDRDGVGGLERSHISLSSDDIRDIEKELGIGEFDPMRI